MPCEFGTPGLVSRRLIVGETANCEISRNAVNRSSPARSPSSWLPHVSTSPPMLHFRAGELGGPQRSLYVSPDSASRRKYSAGGVPGARPAGGGGWGAGGGLRARGPPPALPLQRRRQREAVVDRVHPALLRRLEV